MVGKGIRLLALDWDLTMVSCHTQGQWYGSPKELVKFVRPSMALLACAAATSGLQLAIVSFSGQGELIRETLAIALPHITFILRCSDKKWQVSDKSLQAFFPRQSPTTSPAKLKHLRSAVKQFDWAGNGLPPVVPQNILLIDDDSMNIAMACDNGVNAIQMEPNNLEATMVALERHFFSP